MPEMRLRVVTDTPNSGSTIAVVDVDPRRPLHADGDMTWLCGACGAILGVTMPRRVARDQAFRCGACGNLNDII